jgi:hypothetical protein
VLGKPLPLFMTVLGFVFIMSSLSSVEEEGWPWTGGCLVMGMALLIFM